MTRVLLWKELRDQATVLVALIALGSALLVAVAVLVEPAEGSYSGRMRAFAGSGGMGLVMLLMAAGVVVGASLFAGEVENGTFGFLDRLPASRWRIWWRKVLAGAGLVAIAASSLLAVAFAAGAIKTEVLPVWLFVGFVIAFSAFAWGVLGSTFTKSTLAACGLALGFGTGAALMIVSLVGFAISMAREREPGVFSGQSMEYTVLASFWCVLVIPLPIAAWLFTAPDRSRSPLFEAVPIPGLKGRLPVRFGGGSLRRLVWLVVRQTSGAATVLGVIALILGCTMLIPEVQPIVVFPLLAFAAGVFVAIVGMGDEQQSNGGQFWGERRLPVGRLWFAKVASGLALSLVLTLATVIPLVLAHVLRDDSKGPFVPSLFRTALIEERGFPLASFFLLWPVYGFAFTHLAAVLFRKAIVAAAVGGMVGGAFAAFWFPSLLGGGLHLWQVLLPPLAVLVVARLAVWSWATNRLGNTGPLSRLSAGLATVAVLFGGCLAYRVLEVPLIPEADDHVAFARQLPTFDEKQSGRDLRRAAGMYAELPPSLRIKRAERTLTNSKPFRYANDLTFITESYEVLKAGYPTDRPEYDEWLKQMFAPKWDEPFAEAATKPIGVLEDVNERSVTTTRSTQNVDELGLLLLIRGLERQARGEPAEFLNAFEMVLSAARSAGHLSTLGPTLTAHALEHKAYAALSRWLERLDGRPDLLLRAWRIVRDHETRDTYDPESIRLAEQVFVANAIAVPGQWMPQHLDEERPGTQSKRGVTSAEAEVEGNLVTFAWAVPWERERHRRVVGLGNVSGRSKEQRQFLKGMPGKGKFGFLELQDFEWDNDLALSILEEKHQPLLTRRRAMTLVLAIRQFEIGEGRVPQKLEQLVPKYLPKLPEDPFSKTSFGYRISLGETIPGLREPDDGWPNPPPGSDLIADEYQVLAGAIGGALYWPSTPDWESLLELISGETSVPIDWDRIRKPAGEDAQKGQPILWSIGPDRFDDRGMIANPRPADGKRTGDLVYVVPRRP